MTAPERRGADGTRLVAPWGAASCAALVVLFACRAWWPPDAIPLGYDASSHIPVIAALAQALRGGTGWFADLYNLGFPIGLYYQPLPHVLAALGAAMGGGDVQAASVAYRASTLAALALVPFSVTYLVLRSGGSSRAAMFAALVAPFVGVSWSYGFTSDAALRVGLHTQAWGHVVFPLAVAELAGIVRGQGRPRRAMLACAALAGTHLFLAVAAVPVVVACAAIHAATGGVRERVRTWAAATAWALVRCAGLAAAMLAGWLGPLVATRVWMGGWPTGASTQQDGIGAAAVLRGLFSGAALDGDGTWLARAMSSVPDGGGSAVAAGGVATGTVAAGAWFEAVPALSILALAGAAVAFARLVERRVDAHLERLAFAVAAVGLLGLAGRATFGAGIDVWPLHRSVELFRYAAVAQFGLLLLAVIGAGAVLDGLARGRWLRGVVLAGLVALPVARGLHDTRSRCRTLADVDGLDLDAWHEATRAVRALSGEGRVFVGPFTGLAGHFHGGLLAPWGGRSAGLSYGVGLHDSPHFYTLRQLDPSRPDVAEVLSAFGFRWVVGDPDGLPARLHMATVPRWQNERYAVRELPDASPCGRVVLPGPALAAGPRSLRPGLAAWIEAPWSADRRVPQIAPPRGWDGRDVVGVRDAADAMAVPVEVRAAGPIDADVRCERAASGAERRVQVRTSEPGWLVLPVTCHPWWQATVVAADAAVDATGSASAAVGASPQEVSTPRASRQALATPQATICAAPGLVAVPLADAGTWAVEARFVRPGAWHLLWLGVPLALVAASGRGRRRSEQTPGDERHEGRNEVGGASGVAEGE